MENQHPNLAKSRIPPTVLMKIGLLVLLDFNMSSVCIMHRKWKDGPLCFGFVIFHPLTRLYGSQWRFEEVTGQFFFFFFTEKTFSPEPLKLQLI